MTDPRDRWQAEAFEAFFELSKDSFLIDACPGAGKTRAVTNICVEALRRNWVDQVIIVAPTLEVQNQWAEDSHELGLDLTKNYKNGQMKYRSDAHGVITNYQTVAMSPKDWLILSTRSKRSLVVFDEIHHAADDETKTWGTALMTAFNQVTHRILLTGTPFRTDGGRIPWLTYDSKGDSISDGGISTKQAVQQGVIRPIRIVAMESEAKWNKGAKDYVETAANVKPANQSNLLTAFFDPSGNYMNTTLRRADDELTRLREIRPNAGGLIIADSKENAEKLAARMSIICGEKVEFVHSGDLDLKPSELIDRFRNGNARWIVAVDMISEGVNIPRLCVGVYASRKMTKLWFRQIVGRFVRQIGDRVVPTLFIPNLPDLTKHARELEDEQEAGLKQQQAVIERYRQEQFDYDPTIVLGTSDAVMNQIIERDDTIEDNELRSTEEQMMRAGIPINGTNVADFAKYDRAAAGFADRNSSNHSQTRRPRTATNDELLKNLRDQINLLVNKVARQTGQEHKQIHAILNKQYGDTLGTASVTSATARLSRLQTWT